MKTQRPLTYACLLFILLYLPFAFLQSGCTVAGYFIGASIDKRQPLRDTTIQGWEAIILNDKTHITVFRKDKEPLEGNYKGLVKMNPRTDSVATGLLLQQGSTVEYRIPFERIDHIHVPARKAKGRILGSVIGFVADIGAAIVIVYVGISNSLGGFCPYVYSYDGTGYTLDAEMCSGAFYRAAQCNDLATLEHLRADDNGMYRIKLANEMQESDFIDQLRLLVFEHPRGTQVYPALGGRYLALSKPQPPCSAYNAEGSDIAGLLRDDDEASWLSNPFACDPENAADLRESVDLTFDKPADAGSAALMLKLRNTPWVGEQFRTFLALKGNKLSEWYSELNSDATVRNDLAAAFSRENALLVSVWDGARWRPANPVNIVGPAVDRAVVQEIDLRDIPGGALHIRLECPRGYWMINSAGIDFAYTTASAAYDLPPEKAVARSGENVTDLLARVDGACYSMPVAGDYAEVEFACPAQKPGTERTALIQCNGYYTPQMQGQGEPRTELMDRLLHTPDAYNKWRLQTLKQDMEAFAGPGFRPSR